MPKERITVSLDPQIVARARQAVADGAAPSLSAYIADATAQRADRDELTAVIWQTWGPFTPGELDYADALLDGDHRITP